MVIIFANQKGGVGKTTLSILYANHLAENGKQVILVDTDVQRSCYFKRQSELDNWEEDAIKYKIEPANLTTVEDSQELMKMAHNASKAGCHVIIDVPGNITEDYLGPLFIHSDVIICPFIFESMAIHSTSTFIKVLTMLEKQYKIMKPKKFFVPNMVFRNQGTADEMKQYENAEDILKSFGFVTPKVHMRAELKRINTVVSTPKQKNEVEDCFNYIDNNIF